MICWLYVKELPRTSTMIEQWLLHTKSRRTQMRGLPIWLPLMLMLFCVVTACFEMSPLRVPLVWTLRLFDSSCIFWSSEMWFEVIIVFKPYKHFISFHVSFWASLKLILTFTKWGGVACKTTSVYSPRRNFRPRSTTSINNCYTTIPQSLLSAWMSRKRRPKLNNKEECNDLPKDCDKLLIREQRCQH